MDRTSQAGLGGRSRVRFLAAASIAALASPGVLAWTAPPVAAALAYCDAFTQATPGTYYCEVPDGVTSLDFIVAGGDGGFSSASMTTTGFGGHGARITGSISVTPGEFLDIVVGGNGANGHGYGAGGGGYSSVAREGGPIVVAGAGGGGGWNGGTGGSGTGGMSYDGGGWGGTAGYSGYYPDDATSGGRTAAGGGGGDSYTGWSEDDPPVPTVVSAGIGGFFDSATESPNGGDAAPGSRGGGGGGAFGGTGGVQDPADLIVFGTGATYGAGGNGGSDGGGGGGGYAGGGGGGGGLSAEGISERGGGGGGGSSLVPSGATVSLSLTGAVVTLSGPAPATTLYVVPDDAWFVYGGSVGAEAYPFAISETADGQTPIEPSTLDNYVAPTCGSSYTSSTSVADSPLTISCGGGSNDGTAGSADGVVFDYTATADLWVLQATLYVVPDDQSINTGGAPPNASFYTFGLFVDSAHTVPYEGTVGTPPTCGSAYGAASIENLPISCGGGANAGSAGSDTNFEFDYTDTATLAVNAGPVINVTLRVKGATLAPVIGVVDPEGVDTVGCALDGTSLGDCTNGWKSETLSKGSHTFTITATDSLGASSSYSGSFIIKSGKLR